MSSLFQQKQRELLLAVSRVDELSDQLEALRSSRMEPHHPHLHHGNAAASAAELERLYKELQVRTPSTYNLFDSFAPRILQLLIKSELKYV